MAEEVPRWPNSLPLPSKLTFGARRVHLLPTDFEMGGALDDLIHDLYWFPDDLYYLFYSGSEGGYAVGYATAENVYGPYTRAENNPLFGARHDGALLKDGKTLYDVDHPYRDAGHNQVFKGPDGRYWTSCHAYVKGGDDKYGALLVYDPLEFDNGVIKTPAPTWTTQTVEIDPEMLKLFPRLAN